MKRILTLLIAVILVSPATAQTINNLTAGSAVSGTDLYPSYQGANPAKKVTASQLSTYILGLINGDCTISSGTITCPAKATPLGTGTTVSLTGPRQYYVCTSTCTVTPPVPVAGYEFCVLNGDNVSTVITLAALGSAAMYENTARTAYGTAGTGTLVSSGAAADKICIVGLDSTHYLTTAYNGTWTAN